ncbi:MAG: FHA domain-containing protein [Acidimicrobiia bacterium]|nr:FHA domain-containing protein [Acidimicrobiia bacterium]
MANSKDIDSADPDTKSPNNKDLVDTSATQVVSSILNSDGPIASNKEIEGESYCFEVLRGPTKGDLIFFHDEKNTFGRGTDCTVLLDDITVSRHHCEILSKDGDLILNDTGSTNGTYVNSNAVESCKIETGDVIQIGKFVFALARRTQK